MSSLTVSKAAMEWYLARERDIDSNEPFVLTAPYKVESVSNGAIVPNEISNGPQLSIQENEGDNSLPSLNGLALEFSSTQADVSGATRCQGIVIDSVNLPVGTQGNGFTLSGWFQISGWSASGQSPLIDLKGAGTLSRNGVAMLALRSYADIVVSGVNLSVDEGGLANHNDNILRFYAITYDQTSGDVVLYENGVSVGSGSLTPGTEVEFDRGSPAGIMTRAVGSYRPTYGKCYQVTIRQNSLSADQIAELYRLAFVFPE